MGKGSSWIYIGILGLVIAAVAVTAVLDRTSNKTEDIRAKAGVAATQKMSGVVTAVDDTNGTVTVSNLLTGTGPNQAKAQTKPWVITAPTGFNYALVSPGTKVKMKIIPSTFLITTHTATATEITPVR